jgi:predicted ATPase/DNA-binding CsgD family transcriptional regulator
VKGTHTMANRGHGRTGPGKGDVRTSAGKGASAEEGRDAQDDRGPPPRTAPQTSLPAELTSFVGRSVELARVRQLLGETRLLTLAGAGGCGKTRLALQGAAAATGRFEDGVWWVELAALEDAGLLASTVASSLRLRDRPGQASVEVLREYFEARRALLVLDNCEHLLAACATLVETLLRSGDGLVVLATSREPLAIPGELTYRVPSLGAPSETDSLEDIERTDAVRLFVDRAAQARPGFTLTEENVASIATVCRGVDGIPLAIELAAARVRMLSPQQIAIRLDDRFQLLAGRARTVEPRHQTLRASIDWSHELCCEEERILLRRLSVWTGGFTLAGAEAVSADTPLSRHEVMDLLAGLVDKSLVDTEELGEDVRYGLLETIRHYAAERLADSGEIAATQARHLMWCVELAERAEPELVRQDARAWLQRLEPEAANLRAAFDRALATDPQAALRLAAALTFFWLMTGRLVEGTAYLTRAADAAPEGSAMRGKVLWGMAELTHWSGQHATAAEYAEQAYADGEAAGDSGVMARGLMVKGLMRNLVDHMDRGPLERSIALAREAGDEWCIAGSMRFLASSYTRQGEHDAARPVIDEGHELAEALGNRPLQAFYLNFRAWGELEHGRLPAARECADQALVLSMEIGDPIPIGMATMTLVECDVLEGRAAEARSRGEPFSERMRSMRVRAAHVWVECALALADVAEGDLAAARARLETTLRLIETMPTHDTVSKAGRRLTFVLLLLGDLDGAGREAQGFLSHAQKGQNAHAEALARLLLGRVSLARGELVDAEGHCHDALAIAAARDFRLHTVNALESLARVACLTGSPAEAARLLTAVRAERRRLGVVRWPPEPELWLRVEREVRTALGDDAFMAADVEGSALSIEQAVEYATRARGRRKRPARGWDSLTPTELEVMRHTAAGLTNPQIGERMFISRGTVKAHLSHIFAKLGISSRTELAAQAAKRGVDNA